MPSMFARYGTLWLFSAFKTMSSWYHISVTFAPIECRYRRYKERCVIFPGRFCFFLTILLKWFLVTSKHWHEIFDFSYRKWKIWFLECFRAHDNRVYETGAELDLHRRTVDSAAFLNIFFLQCFHPQQQQHKQRVRE